MCGLVGLFFKDKSLEPQLGSFLSEMLVSMTGRGPDSAGIAIYREAEDGLFKITVQSDAPDKDFNNLAAKLKCQVKPVDTHAIITCSEHKAPEIIQKIQGMSEVRIMSQGKSIEIYKEVGLPEDVVDRFNIGSLQGTHGIGHTRLATESEITTIGAHPFSTGHDQCLVHNGALSNHNSLRRFLSDKGVRVTSKCDTESAAAYLTMKMEEGAALGEALEAGLKDIDGCYTFVVGTKQGFAVMRDTVGVKPAIMAETDQYVALGSEYRALVTLPGIKGATVWEPEPATVYTWEH